MCKITAKEFFEWYFHSYRLCQGDVPLQYLLFDYLHVVHPDFRITPDLAAELKTFLPAAMEKFASKSRRKATPLHSSVKGTGFDKRFVREMVMGNIAEGTEDNSKIYDKPPVSPARRRKLVLRIAKGIIKRDHYYLIKCGGRPRAPSAKQTPHSDPMLSHFIYYCIQGHSTGVPEYDMLFRDIRKLRKELPDKTKAMLREIRNVLRRDLL